MWRGSAEDVAIFRLLRAIATHLKTYVHTCVVDTSPRGAVRARAGLLFEVVSTTDARGKKNNQIEGAYRAEHTVIIVTMTSLESCDTIVNILFGYLAIQWPVCGIGLVPYGRQIHTGGPRGQPNDMRCGPDSEPRAYGRDRQARALKRFGWRRAYSSCAKGPQIALQRWLVLVVAFT